jgi:hypothetical protein
MARQQLAGISPRQHFDLPLDATNLPLWQAVRQALLTIQPAGPEPTDGSILLANSARLCAPWALRWSQPLNIVVLSPRTGRQRHDWLCRRP